MSRKEELTNAIEELCDIAKAKKGQIFLIGCSTSEVCGYKIGSHSAEDVGLELAKTAVEVLKKKGLYLAVQCCEHLNRAIVISREAAEKFNFEIVNVLPQLKAGGSMATATYKFLDEPVMVENVKADMGIDIGGVMIGMRLKEVAVPVRLQNNKIGEASVAGARVRPKFIGGERACYDQNLK